MEINLTKLNSYSIHNYYINNKVKNIKHISYYIKSKETHNHEPHPHILHRNSLFHWILERLEKRSHKNK